MDIKGFNQNGESKNLVVVFHAYTSSPEKLTGCINVIKNTVPDCDIYAPKIKASAFSLENPYKIVTNFKEVITTICNEKEYDNIIFVGHSLGSLLIRKLYIELCKDFDQTDKKNFLNWVPKISKIILIAGMNRGWSLSHHLSIKSALIYGIGSIIGYLTSIIIRRELLIFNIRKGASFLTQLRIEWIQMRNKADATGAGKAKTFQLLGSVDDLVSPEDNIDLISGRDFYYLDVPYSGHADIINMDDPTIAIEVDALLKNELNKKDITVGELRSFMLELCLGNDHKKIEKHRVTPSDFMIDEIDEDVNHVVFVIHGIRDKGYWTHKIARRIVKEAKLISPNLKVATETSSYGYFPLLSFLLPMKRRQKVEWFMDQYAECTAFYPNATFSFVGHSNGTYLLAKAFKEYSVCKFEQVVFAGSVVRQRYNWTKNIEQGQVKKVLNFTASGDWVVAIFPKAIEMLKIQDLGSAGHDGFDINKNVDELINNKGPIKGSHGAALKEKNWNSISRFILTGELSDTPLELKSKKNHVIHLISKVSPLIWIFIFGLVVSGYIGIYLIDLNSEPICFGDTSRQIFLFTNCLDVNYTVKSILTVLYSGMIGWILTKL